MRIFKYQQNLIKYNKSRSKPKSNPQENNDINEGADSNSKVDEDESEAEGEGKGENYDFFLEEQHVQKSEEDMPYFIKILFKNMTPQVYKEKLSDPSWFYRSINL